MTQQSLRVVLKPDVTFDDIETTMNQISMLSGVSGVEAHLDDNQAFWSYMLSEHSTLPPPPISPPPDLPRTKTLDNPEAWYFRSGGPYYGPFVSEDALVEALITMDNYYNAWDLQGLVIRKGHHRRTWCGTSIDEETKNRIAIKRGDISD